MATHPGHFPPMISVTVTPPTTLGPRLKTTTYQHQISMESQTSTFSTTLVSSSSSSSSPSSSSSSASPTSSSIFSTLFPPRFPIRPRSLSSATLASSRSVTPAPSIAPSSPDLSIPPPRPFDKIEQPRILEFAPRIIEHLDARDILNLSQTTRRCLELRTLQTFKRHLTLNGWDAEAVVRRAVMAESFKGRPWMFVARSAVHKDDILQLYASLPKGDEKKRLLKDKKANRAVEKCMQILVDVVTEHDHHNFGKLASLANSCNLTLIQFVTAIPAPSWKTRYQKTFVIAAYVNSQPLHPDGEGDLEKLAQTFNFEDPTRSQSLVATRANFIYIYGCMANSMASPFPLSSNHYDPPHVRTSRGSTPPGLESAIERFKTRMRAQGFYRKSGGDMSAMKVAIEPVGLASKLPIPFSDKDLITLTATVSDGEGNPPWRMDGSVNMKTGAGKLKSASGMVYELWVTPWGVTGQKLLAEGKRLGYFVLHWAS